MNTEAPSATPASNAPRLKRIFKRSAWIMFLALLNVWVAQAQTPSNIPASEGPTAINGCPVRLNQLRPLRGFRLGMTLTEFRRGFQGDPLQFPEPDHLGVRTIKFKWSQERRNSTDLDTLEFRLSGDHLYQIEATYSIGAEWDQQPWRDFAGAISRGLGVEASWSEMSPKQFRLDCGDVRFELQVMEPFMSISSLPAGQIASAFLTLTDTKSEALVKQREDAYRRQQPQRNAERRRVFKP